MTAFLEAIGLKWLTLIAGFLGAVVSLKFIDGLSVVQRVSTVVAGSAIAGYCTVLVVDLFGLSTKLDGPVAFLIGLFGMSIAGALMKAIPEWISAARQKFLGGS